METTTSSSHFAMDQSDKYLAWRERKLSQYPSRLEDLVVEVADPGNLTHSEHEALLARCRRANMAIYAGSKQVQDKESIHSLGRQFGLTRLDHNPGADEDAITALTVQDDAYHRDYIPYTNKAIAWHADGYYNSLELQIYSIILHCVQPAATGGRNQLLDHELLYIALRDHNPYYIRALMHPQAMTIPANVVDGVETRPASSGPVFKVSAHGTLHMRYTDRTRSIIWRDEPVTQEAVKFIKNWLHQPDNHYCFDARLEAGQGLIANNVLHTRSTFVDGTTPRLLYRARYYDRIHST